jgi:putative tricarboxylic transport membrane protein
MEQSFRQAMTISNGSMKIFAGSGVAIALIIITIASIAYPLIKASYIKKKMNIVQ